MLLANLYKQHYTAKNSGKRAEYHREGKGGRYISLLTFRHDQPLRQKSI